MILIYSEESATDALKSQDANLRYQAAWWLGKNRIASAVPLLVECLKDKRERTIQGGFPLRRQAARSLGLIGDPICTKSLLKTLKAQDVILHEAAIRALISIGKANCS